jgi:23S rRNA (uracil1939-C5)-methyltransferase
MPHDQNKKKRGQNSRKRRVNKPENKDSFDPRPGESISEVVKISEFGHHGDGVATLKNGENCYIPYTLPGETVKIERTRNVYKLIEIQKASENRIKPFCDYFTVCGGCKIQHLELSIYQSWKHGIVQKALINQGIDIPVAPLIDAHGKGRRRVSFHAKRENGQIQVGLMKYHSHEILNIDKCPILVPELSSGINIARDITRVIPSGSKPLNIQLTATESGIDCNINGCPTDGSTLFTKIAELANKYDLARISFDRDIIIERNSPVISIADAKIILPPSSFLQPTISGENILASLVLEHLKDVTQIADLYCGIGTFAIRMAKRSTITAYDNNALSIEALTKAINHTQGLKPVIAIERDLSREPLFPQELKKFGAIIFDPPRAGAAVQAQQLATSTVNKIIAVSCNPASFALDASILIKGGFVLKRVTPIDQFKFTSHIELVALFERT